MIRRRKRHLWSKPETKLTEEPETETDLDEKLIFSPVHKIVKRTSDYCFSQSSNSTSCFPIASGALTAGLLAILFVGAKLQSGIFGGGQNNGPTFNAQRPVQVERDLTYFSKSRDPRERSDGVFKHVLYFTLSLARRGGSD